MLFVKKLDPRANVPTCAHPGEDLAYDLYALEDAILFPGVTTKVRTGVAVEHCHAEYGQDEHGTGYSHYADGLLIRDRSSMAEIGIYVSGGVIDAGYRGEIMVVMTKLGGSFFGNYTYKIEAGNKIAQMVPTPVLTGEGVMEVVELHPSARGSNGFGSSGR